jgi:hypothetical protein
VEGEERRGAGGAGGYGGGGKGAPWGCYMGRGAWSCTAVRELAAVWCWELLHEEERKEERERKRRKGRKKRKGKNADFFSNMKFFVEKYKI